MRVLLADDNPTNRLVIEMILAAAGVEAFSVENGLEALEYFKRAPFDVVLMDIQMPVMDGLTCIEAIRAYEAQAGLTPTPIHVISAHGQPQHMAASARVGADSHMTKPVSQSELLAVVSRSTEAVMGALEREAEPRKVG